MDKKRNIIVIFLIALISTVGVYAQSNFSNTIDIEDGLHILTYRTPVGNVKVFLPDDLSAGDTISALVVAYPGGNSQNKKTKNLNTLNNYYLEAGTDIVPVGSGYITMNISKNMAGSNLKFTLRDNQRREIRTSTVPVQLFWSAIDLPEVPTALDYHIPLIGQSGRLVEIKGPFDGQFSTTSFKVGGKQASIVAESPRKLIFETPVDVIGATELELREENVVVKRPFTNLRVVKIGQDGVVAVHQIASQTRHNEQLVGPTVIPEPKPKEVHIEEVVEVTESVEEDETRAEIIEEVIVEPAVEQKSHTEEMWIVLAKQMRAPVSGVVVTVKKETEPLEVVSVEETVPVPEAEITESAEIIEDIEEEETIAEPDGIDAGIVQHSAAEEESIEVGAIKIDPVAESTQVADIIREQLSRTITVTASITPGEPEIDTQALDIEAEQEEIAVVSTEDVNVTESDIDSSSDIVETQLAARSVPAHDPAVDVDEVLSGAMKEEATGLSDDEESAVHEAAPIKVAETVDVTDESSQIEVEAKQEDIAGVTTEDVKITESDIESSSNIADSQMAAQSAPAPDPAVDVDETLSGAIQEETEDLSETNQDGSYTVQVASFKKQSDAREFASILRAKGYNVFVVMAEIPGKGTWNRVRVGTFLTKEEALDFGNKLSAEEPTITSTFVAENK